MDKAVNPVIEALIKAGASEAKYYNSDLALQITELMSLGRISSAKITPIMGYGADLTIPNKKGQKVLDYASVRDLLRCNYGLRGIGDS